MKDMSYRMVTLLFALVLFLAAAVLGYASARWPALARKLPRHQVLGGIVGLVCLVWSGMLVQPMLEGGLLGYRPLVKYVVAVVAVLCYFHLEYLFTRALGGLILLLVNQMLTSAFAVGLPARPLFAIPAYAFGIAGLLLIASPWMCRDLLEKSAAKRNWRFSWGGGLAVSALFFTVFAFLA
jgi:hypothetical protein